MIVVNFSHPLTAAQQRAIEALAAAPIERLLETQAQFRDDAPFALQTQRMVDGVDLSAAAWQQERIVVGLPALNVIAGALVAELHGRMGYFPTVVRLRRVAESTPPQYEVAELLDLQTIRDSARTTRNAGKGELW